MNFLSPAQNVQTAMQENLLKGYIEERAIQLAEYIVEYGATVRQAAKNFGISKSTVHMVVTI